MNGTTTKEPPFETPLTVDAASSDAAAAQAPAEPATVLRFDIHQRLQHGLMIISFLTLVLTGWPLAAHGVGVSAKLVQIFGGLQRTGIIHRVAAVGMGVCALYHVGYLAVLLEQHRLRFSMLPTPADLRHLVHNISYFIGIRKTRPHFGRYTYFEKFDYWAVFWGVVIMGVSGLVRWFPVQATNWLPTRVYEVSYFAHADEALLAAMAIFIWHFYNVHLRPAVFPMSRVFLTGRLTRQTLEEEHPAEYQALVAKDARDSEATDQ